MRCHAPQAQAKRPAAAAVVQTKPAPRPVLAPVGANAGFSFADVPVHAPPAGGAGLPERLRAGVEHLCGLAMDDVRVHRDSPAPARLGALAFANGSDIHLGPGQERHLPHEAWHVVQQKQGRVTAAIQLKGTTISGDAALEAEADRLGGRAGGGAGPGLAEAAPVDDAELELPEACAGMAREVEKAKARVAKEAKDKFDGDYEAAFDALCSDPTLWADFRPRSKSARTVEGKSLAGKEPPSSMQNYVYLPSCAPLVRKLDLHIGFDFPVDVAGYIQQWAECPAITMNDVLQHVSDSARIAKAIAADEATVTIEGALSFETVETKSKTKTSKLIQPIVAPEDIKDGSAVLIEKVGADVESCGSGCTKRFRLKGSVAAEGMETKLALLTIKQGLGGTKEKCVKANFQ